MYLFKVTPTKGSYEAPFLLIEADKDVKAIEIAKQKSGLGRFSSWVFVAKQLKELKQKRNFHQDAN